MTPAGIFLNRGICLVCTQEELLGPFRWKMKAFWVRLLYSESIVDLQFCSKRVSEQNQTQFYQSYWVQNDTAQFVSHTSQKKNLP